ncbi:MAG: chorismate-binding protein, partial [Methanotrichaceae archaeon]
FAISESTFIFDHLTRRVYFTVAPIFPGAKTDLIEIIEGFDSEDVDAEDMDGGTLSIGDKDRYQEAVLRSKTHIKDGDIFQVVLARSARVRCSNPIGLYRRLRSINPSPYTYLFEFGELSIIGASPETLFSAYAGRLKVNPIAGTCPRGKTSDEDDELAKTMLNDDKERAEHVMLVDLGRNDVRSVCKSGTIKVEDFMSVLKYSHVQHIETTVVGDLRDECDQFDAARAVFPAGTLSGAPKLRAMEIIDDLETEPRGIYGGGIGYFSVDGCADFAIAIRSILIQDGVATVQAGAGIVADSDPYREYLETERKMAAMKHALGAA